MASTEPAASSPMSLADVFKNIAHSEDVDLRTCFAAEINAFLTSLSLRSGRDRVEAADVPLLLERFNLALLAARPLARGPSQFAPGRRRLESAEETGIRAVGAALGNEAGTNSQ